MSAARITAAMQRAAVLRDEGVDRLFDTNLRKLTGEFPDLRRDQIISAMKADVESRWMDCDADLTPGGTA